MLRRALDVFGARQASVCFLVPHPAIDDVDRPIACNRPGAL